MHFVYTQVYKTRGGDGGGGRGDNCRVRGYTYLGAASRRDISAERASEEILALYYCNLRERASERRGFARK